MTVSLLAAKDMRTSTQRDRTCLLASSSTVELSSKETFCLPTAERTDPKRLSNFHKQPQPNNRRGTKRLSASTATTCSPLIPDIHADATKVCRGCKVALRADAVVMMMLNNVACSWYMVSSRRQRAHAKENKWEQEVTGGEIGILIYFCYYNYPAQI